MVSRAWPIPASQRARSITPTCLSRATFSTSSRVMSRMKPAGTRLSRATASSVQVNSPPVGAVTAASVAASKRVVAIRLSQPAPSFSRPTVSSIRGNASSLVITGIFRERAYFSIRAFARRRR